MELLKLAKALFIHPDVPGPAVPAPAPETIAAIGNPYPNAPDYVQKALSYLGRNETNNITWVMNLFRMTSYPMKWVTRSTAWCAAFVCDVLEETDYKQSRSAAAIGQSQVGEPMPEDEPFGICVWEHMTGGLKGHHHTNICLEAYESGRKRCIGGNQGDAVTFATYGLPNYKLVAYRKPVKR